MYKEDILDLYRNPRNEGRIENGLQSEGENPSCGDHIHVSVEVGEGEIKKVMHETEGCAISTAAASILTEELEGMSVEKVKQLDADWIVEKMGIDISPMRVKCAVLGLKTVQKTLEKN